MKLLKSRHRSPPQSKCSITNEDEWSCSNELSISYRIVIILTIILGCGHKSSTILFNRILPPSSLSSLLLIKWSKILTIQNPAHFIESLHDIWYYWIELQIYTNTHAFMYRLKLIILFQWLSEQQYLMYHDTLVATTRNS